ncbi:MAG: NADH-quinone oxidoreductase subunit C, partial [Muribaculaceae bacterium]|nr:NADH-quinone oxidoreductase subunit C [Muribaculaceae bacterium]
MATIQDKISKLFPAATFEQADTLQITVPDAQLQSLARTLRDDADLAFDFLVTIVGMDWKDSMGCIYYLSSSVHSHTVAVKVSTADRERPMLHSVSEIWTIAEIFEREVYDFFGIVFIGNKDMRRLFLNIDWVGYPLRKDYDEN